MNMEMINEKELFMSQEDIKAAISATKARSLKISTEDKIKMNCSHHNLNGKLTVMPRVIKVSNGDKFVDKKVLVCTTCGSVIEQITEAEFKQIIESFPAVATKVINYVKTFDKKMSEEERRFLVMTKYCILHLMMIFESTVVDARKAKNNNQQQGPKKMITSGSLFGGRY